jgi:hypothetical protein
MPVHGGVAGLRLAASVFHVKRTVFSFFSTKI